MQLPDDIKLTPVMFLDMAKGGWSHSYRNDELGLNVVKRAETRKSKPEMDIWFDHFPNYCWHSVEALRKMVVDIGINNSNGEDDGNNEGNESKEDRGELTEAGATQPT